MYFNYKLVDVVEMPDESKVYHATIDQSTSSGVVTKEIVRVADKYFCPKDSSVIDFPELFYMECHAEYEMSKLKNTNMGFR